MATSKKPEKLCMVLQTDDKGANWLANTKILALRLI